MPKRRRDRDHARRRSPRTTVRKSTGEIEAFSRKKFRESLRQSGARPREVDVALEEVEENLRPEIPSEELYKIARRTLQRERRPVAARYSLKKALLALGPTGYPFERIVAGIFAARGYTARTGVVLRGRCVSHELDVVARRRGEAIFAECKFHNQARFRSDVKTAMYVSARARDLQERGSSRSAYREFWLVTNTRFTSEARRFAECTGLHAVSWDTPAGGSLRELVQGHGLHPVTCLTTLSKARRRELVSRDIVLCDELRDRSEVLSSLGLSQAQIRKTMTELDGLAEIDAERARRE